MKIAYAFLLFAGILLLILSGATPVIKSSAELSMFNTDWDGCSEFASLLNERGKVVPLLYPYNTAGLGELHGTLVILGPDTAFSGYEAAEVSKFLEKGGVVLVGGEGGAANNLLGELGVRARFSEQSARDIFYSKRAEFPAVVRIGDPKLIAGVEKLTLNVPSVIVGQAGEVFTSKVSVAGGRRGSYPVVGEVKYGEGRIVMLSDPSILINDMFQENRQFIENLAPYLGGGSTYYIDEAHHSDFNPFSAATVYIQKELDREGALLVFALVVALAMIVEGGIASRLAHSIDRLRPRREENIFEGLPERVDREAMEKIIREIKTGSKLGERYGAGRVFEEVEERV